MVWVRQHELCKTTGVQHGDRCPYLQELVQTVAFELDADAAAAAVVAVAAAADGAAAAADVTAAVNETFACSATSAARADTGYHVVSHLLQVHPKNVQGPADTAQDPPQPGKGC